MKTALSPDFINIEVLFQPQGFSLDFIQTARDVAESTAPLDEPARWYERFCRDKYLTLLYFGFTAKSKPMPPSLTYLYRIADFFVRKLSAQTDIELMREETALVPSPEELTALLDAAPFANGSEFITEDWILTIWNRLLQAFCQEIKSYDGTVAAYFLEHNAQTNVVGRIFFHLVENKGGEYPFAFMATYSTRPTGSKKAIHTPLKIALEEFQTDEDKLLSLMSSVVKAAGKSTLIADLMESGELFSPLYLTIEDAYCFLKEIPLYEESGIMCRVPDWWRKRTNSLSVSVTMGEKKVSTVGLDALLDFKPKLSIDGETLTLKQLKEFLTMAEGLIQYKGKWVEINKKKLTAALDAFERAKGLSQNDGITIAEAMRMELTAAENTGSGQESVEFSVTNGKWLKELRDRLLHPELLESVALEPSVHATLRPYQQNGYKWLYTMGQLGFGACLADDMGLGKTIQLISYFEYFRQHHGGRALLVLPASLIGNWQNEIERFAPELSYQILHKSADSKGSMELDEHKFLHITTYGMVGRLDILAEKPWDLVVLDEAQAIKNAGTKQSKAVKAIPAAFKIALTGTPIENSLGDLWSLFDFLNPGLLGTAKEFAGFIKQLNDNGTGYGRLKKIVNPFILRRLKTDRLVISDLPDKIEIKEYAGLSKKQTALYQKLLDELELKIRTADGIERKGLVLASLIKFKQICNHPDQYLALDLFKKENSGKFQQLEQICETIYEKKERVLIFTQFREMVEPISDFLETIFKRRGLTLHGGTQIKKRSQLVEQFNGEAYVPYMVLSLKAGGVGLNLTAANHVIHFDRWWNPAVENQATDRAFRIGQTKDVMVYKFVTKGTVEEKIDAMIENKQKLAGDILSSAGEQWITELDNDTLMDLFRLEGRKS